MSGGSISGCGSGATEGFAPIRAAWLARAAGLGEEIRVRLERATLFGRFLDLDDDGALLLDTAEGPPPDRGRRGFSGFRLPGLDG